MGCAAQETKYLATYCDVQWAERLPQASPGRLLSVPNRHIKKFSEIKEGGKFEIFEDKSDYIASSYKKTSGLG